MNKVPQPMSTPVQRVALSAAILRGLLLLRQQQQVQQPCQAPPQPAT